MTEKSELTRLLKIFRALDIDNDGHLTRDELICGYKQIAVFEGDIETLVDSIIE